MIPVGEANEGTYLVTWNGHGDALALWRVNADGTLTLANSFSYDTWGKPTTQAHNGIDDLGFRFLYVGSRDVQWDSGAALANLDMYYMHARHYSPPLGRFLQPDPTGSEPNPYAYAGSNPTSHLDAGGTSWARALIELIKRFGPRVVAWLRTAVVVQIGPFALAADRLAHIVVRHASNVALAASALHSKFLNDGSIISLIQATLSRGAFVAQGGGRWVFHMQFSSPVGINGVGQNLYWVRVVIQECGWFCSPYVVTAYPVVRP